MLLTGRITYSCVCVCGGKHNLQLKIRGTRGLPNMYALRHAILCKDWWITGREGCFLSCAHRWLLHRLTMKEEEGKEREGNTSGGLSINSFYCSLVFWPLNQPPKDILPLFLTVTILVYVLALLKIFKSATFILELFFKSYTLYAVRWLGEHVSVLIECHLPLGGQHHERMAHTRHIFDDLVQDGK